MSVRALRWQDFSSGEETDPSKSAPLPEAPPAPDAETLETMLAKARGKGRADGFAEGVAMAEARAETELRMVLQTIAEQIADMNLSRAAQRREIIDISQSLTETLFKAIAPALAKSSVMAEIRATVTAALDDVPSNKLLVAASPGTATAIAEMLEEAQIPVRVDEDPDLGSLAARVHWRGGFDQIDLDACIDRALALLGSHSDAARAAITDDTQPEQAQRRQVNE